MAAKKEDKTRQVLAKLRSMTDHELREKLKETTEELMTARFRHASATLENTSELKTKRRLIARIETVLNEKGQKV